jgi:hypothetical protein
VEKKHGPVEVEKQVDALLVKADQLLATAEQTPDRTGVYENCRAAVRHLLEAYLLALEENTSPLTNLAFDQLWEKCVALDPEILPLVADVRLFLDEPGTITTEEEAEIVIDAANELWDFIFDSLHE